MENHLVAKPNKLRGSTTTRLNHYEAQPLSGLQRANILATLAYYDVFDWPLKTGEIFERSVDFKHLEQSSDIASQYISDLRCPKIEEMKSGLDQLILERQIGFREGYYFLDDKEYLVPLRLKREKIANRKWLIAKRAVWWLRFVPYLRAVSASGSLAMRNTDELSDLDVLIIVKHGRIWLSRFLILGVLALLGKRRRGNDRIAPDKICPNHFLTDSSLNISFKSIYTAQLYANLVPIYVRDPDIMDKFKKANDWVLDYVYGWNIEDNDKEVEPLLRGSTSNKPRSVEVKPQQHPMFGSSTSKHWVKMVEWFLDCLGIAGVLEKWLGQYQSRRIARNLVTRQTGGRVIFTDEQLEFHPHSIETQIIKGYNERLRKLNLPGLAVEKDSGLT